MDDSAGRLESLIEAFNAGGVEAALPYADPEILWRAPPEWLEQSEYRGHQGLRQLAGSWGENFDDYRLELEQVVALEGHRAVVLLHQQGRIKGGGHEVKQAVAWIVEFANGRLARVDAYFGWEPALEAAGLSDRASRPMDDYDGISALE